VLQNQLNPNFLWVLLPSISLFLIATVICFTAQKYVAIAYFMKTSYTVAKISSKC